MADDHQFWIEIQRGLGQIAAGLAQISSGLVQIMTVIAKHKLAKTTTQ